MKMVVVHNGSAAPEIVVCKDDQAVNAWVSNWIVDHYEDIRAELSNTSAS